MQRASALLGLIFLGLALACSGSTSGTDAGSSPPNDAGQPPGDAGLPRDAGVVVPGACAYAYCEDFDAYDAGSITNNMAVGPWVATVNGPMTQMRIDSLNPYSGAHALHVTMIGVATTDAGLPSRATLNQRVTDGGRLIASNDMFGRVRVFFTDGGFFSDGGEDGLPLNVHSWFFSTQGAKLDGGAASMNLGGGSKALQLNYHTLYDGGEQSITGGSVTTGAWHCVQWELNGSGAHPANVDKVWLDGTQVIDAEQKSEWVLPSFWSFMDFGFNHYQVTHNPVDVYLDDFALDGAMIPCE